jgi:hypothetical protein
MIPQYPNFSDITLDLRDELDPLLREYNEGLSEFTFAGLFLFRKKHHYRVSRVDRKTIVVAGHDDGQTFFMLPVKIPEPALIDELLAEHRVMKCVSETKQAVFAARGYRVIEDRDNFDYLYFRTELANLPGKKFHKKRNLLTGFLNNYSCEGKPLTRENLPAALQILSQWQANIGEAGDYDETREALELYEELKLCGALYYVGGIPAAFVLGEPLVEKLSYVIHYEKADTTYKGIYQFVNKAFASVIPRKYIYVNREQDIGDEGLRQAKLTYRPCSFVKKYRVMRA